ncbi:MAG: FlgD immunoglobulin-like domain containing protein [Candidatus Eisenbacteria bacterium]|nr:FlgD immunoglobulin-like domain containing protein [Candidatus Eisenbacteria bacterium]
MNVRRLVPAALLLLAIATPSAHAFVPQTITVDGINDFDPSNRIDMDAGDTEIKNWCTGDPENDAPMDLGSIYITNDNSFLYVGYFYERDCFTSPQPNLGMALDVNDAAGNVADRFGRKIAWNTVPFKPDYYMYDVLDGFNYEELQETNGAGGWVNISTQVNPSWGSGSNGLGIIEGGPSPVFVEYKLPLSVFDKLTVGGLVAGNTIHVEWWMTQDGTSKPPLDASFSDGVQTSTPTGTVFDVVTAVEMTGMHTYVIQALTDVTPPTVTAACATNFAVQPNKQFALTTTKVDVSFSEPVDLATAQNTANYAITNIGGATVTGAVRDGTVSSLVHLTLSGSIGAANLFRQVTVTGVKDQANNTIVNNGTTNRKTFFIQNLVFEGDFTVGLCKGVFAPADTFAVEGNLAPLSFALCDNAVMTDTNVDSTYTVTVPFCMQQGGNGKAEADLEWKFSRACSQFEPIGGNRAYHLTSDNGASATLTGFWNNDDPVNFTSKAIDVIFNVNTSLFGAGTVTLLGSQSPLSFTQPGAAMAPVGGNVYRATVRFPKCTAKNVQWKVDYNGVIECTGQGDRNVFLNDALFGIVGSAEGPITLPARGINRCTVTDKAVRVVFKVDSRIIRPDAIPPGDTIVVAATQPPLSFVTLPDPDGVMFDNGVSPDATAGDRVFTRQVTFPDSTPFNVEYKFWLNREDGLSPITGGPEFECAGVGNRTFQIDDVAYSVAVPQVRPLNYWSYCSDVTGVGDIDGAPRPGRIWAELQQNYPNPFNPVTTIRFELQQAGPTHLTVYDVAGRQIVDLLDGTLDAGQFEVIWDGRDTRGQVAPSGVYYYELTQGTYRLARRMTVVQ